MNRLNLLCAYAPLYRMDLERNVFVPWDCEYNRMMFGIRDAVRRPSKVTFDTLTEWGLMSRSHRF